MREMFLANGFNDYLTKPIEISKLNDLMERWVPQEKRKKIENRAAADSKTESGLKIVGIDVTRGIARTGGTEERYLKVLELFCRDADERLEILREVPDEHSLPLFTTQVHALKSASASIGAEPLSCLAAELESCGKNGDIGAIRAQLGGFRSDLASLIERIRETLPQNPTFGGPVDKKTFILLREALESENVREADRMVGELSASRLDDKAAKTVSAIADSLLVSDFQEAVREIDGFMKEESP
jgi:HPt (histidine-containing phosphotransfer) domain-containing protein